MDAKNCVPFVPFSTLEAFGTVDDACGGTDEHEARDSLWMRQRSVEGDA